MECVKNVDATPLRSDSSEYLPAVALSLSPLLKNGAGKPAPKRVKLLFFLKFAEFIIIKSDPLSFIR